MKFTLKKASVYRYSEEITINTLEDLEAIQKRAGYELIVNFEERTIWIYDDYME